MPERQVVLERVGGQLLVQDLGRIGLAHLGVPRSGALDVPAHALANRLVGNPEAHATLECLGGGVRLRCESATTLAVTGARVPVTVDGRAVEWGNAVAVPRGAVVALGVPVGGIRSYLALAGGVAVAEELGSRSTDLLSGLGPEPLAEGDVLPLGPEYGDPAPVDVVLAPAVNGRLELVPGPRTEWFADDVLGRLAGAAYTVSSDSNRIGLRLEGEPLAWSRDEQLPSEGMVLGAVQVPPHGQPVVFLADHPTTGGYPVVGVVSADSVTRCAQLRPGDEVRFAVLGGR